jgi:hypothetical protein
MYNIPQENCVPHETRLEPRWRPRLRRAALVTAGALAVGVAVTACGSGPSTPGVAAGPTTTATANPSAAASTHPTGLLAYASCMRSHGVANFPDPAGSGGIPKEGVIRAFRAVSNSQAEAAQNDCRHLLPTGGSLSGQASQPVTAQDQQDYLKAAACMRSHGITDFPDPTFSNGTVTFHEPSGLDTHSTQFTRAAHTCRKLIPAGLPDSGSGG